MKYKITADKPESKYNLAKGVNKYYICTSSCVSHGCVESFCDRLLQETIVNFAYDIQPQSELIFANWSNEEIRDQYEEQYLESDESVEYEWEVIEG